MNFIFNGLATGGAFVAGSTDGLSRLVLETAVDGGGGGDGLVGPQAVTTDAAIAASAIPVRFPVTDHSPVPIGGQHSENTGFSRCFPWLVRLFRGLWDYFVT
ncbi:hypothetical protein ACFQ1S_14345 [Kibdelosporangium lantanae]|uniref:Secreted protein n=1 Tax=Kibdelosporangium lantanae TaxID=1497396 RepID=A0ABW3M8G3_9PSEU